MRSVVSIALATAVAVQLVACNDSPLPTRPPEARPSKLLAIGGGIPLPTPTPILNPNAFVAITAGAYHTCALRRNGNLYCWGSNDYGQALATTSFRCYPGWCLTVPTLVATGVAQVSAGYDHTCFLSGSGVASCGGNNDLGQLGLGSLGYGFQSGQVAGGLTFSAISAGQESTCGLATTGVYCWGHMPIAGNESYWTWPVIYSTPQQITSFAGYKSLSVGQEYFCAHFGTPPWSETDCYGENHYGNINQDTAQWPNSRGIMLGTSLGNSTMGVSASADYTCANQASGVVLCFGWGKEGELGNGQLGQFWQAQLVGNGQRLSGVTTGTYHACALDPNGLAYCWGAYQFGDLNAPGVWTTPAPVLGSPSFVAIAAGTNHTCGIGTDNHIWCWGDDAFGQLGVSNFGFGYSRVPVQATDPTT